MKTLRQQLAAWAVDEKYPHTAELTDIIMRVESYNQFLPGVHQNVYPAEVIGRCSHLCGSLLKNGGDITCYFVVDDDVFEEADTITIPNSVLDADDWEVEIKRLVFNRHEFKLKQDVQYYKNNIHAYEQALIQHKRNLAEAELALAEQQQQATEAERKLLALRSHPV